MVCNEFERLVNCATGGDMLESEVSDVVKQLKGEKAKIMRVISKMPAGDGRRATFAKLHTLMYELYDAKVYVDKDTNKKRDAIANMVLCYDCK